MYAKLRFQIALLSIAAFTVGATACGDAARDAKSPASSEAAGSATTTSARSDSNKALVVRYLDDVWAHRNLDAVSKYVAADLVNHGAVPEAQGAEGLKSIATKLFAAFPDMKTQVINVATDGDEIVIVRETVEATHTGNLDFKTPLPATGKRVKIDQVHTYRIRDGHIVETWMVMDRFDFLTQLGALPKPPGH
jgi:predicted ester cyclase